MLRMGLLWRSCSSDAQNCVGAGQSLLFAVFNRQVNNREPIYFNMFIMYNGVWNLKKSMRIALKMFRFVAVESNLSTRSIGLCDSCRQCLEPFTFWCEVIKIRFAGGWGWISGGTGSTESHHQRPRAAVDWTAARHWNWHYRSVGYSELHKCN